MAGSHEKEYAYCNEEKREREGKVAEREIEEWRRGEKEGMSSRMRKGSVPHVLGDNQSDNLEVGHTADMH